MIRNIPVNAEMLGAVATGHVEPVMPWLEKDGRRQPGTEQERDEETGQLLWTVHCMVPTGDRPELIAVRVPASQQPVVTPFGPVDLHGLEVRVNVNRQTGQLAGYWSAVGVIDPANAAGKGHKGGQQAEQREHVAA